MDYIEQIKERILLSEVVREKVQLQKKGGNFLGRCPFHKEKTASFTVSDDKQFYHCFGCGVHGDVFDFVMKFEGINFTQALYDLAERVGIKIEAKQKTQHPEILELAAKWFQKNLNNKALSYLGERHISNKSIQEFNLGCAPPGGIKGYLQKEGYPDFHIAEAGLISKNYKEYFYDRIIFPIYDGQGKVIGFGGRTFNNGNPKYLNSPESDLFKKSESLYGLHLAKAAKTDNVIVVEGYFDVIALSQVGIKNVVAPLGTAFTVAHMQKLFKLYQEIIVCFDGDNAGKSAILKTIKLALSEESAHKVKFIISPQGKDPCDLVIEHGSEFFESLTHKTTSETLWEVLGEEFDLSVPEEKIKLKNELFEYLKILKDKSEIKYYQNFFFKKLHQVNKRKSNSYHLLSSINVNVGEILTKIVLSYPELLEGAAAEERFVHFKMETNTLNRIQDFIISLLNKGKMSELTNSSSDLSIEIKKILNNHYDVQNKEQALIIWNRLMVLEEIKHLESEYNTEMARAINNQGCEIKASAMLKQILELKSSLIE